jgi:hypothetical protein
MDLDFSIPEGLPEEVVRKLIELKQELDVSIEVLVCPSLRILWRPILFECLNTLQQLVE